MTYLKRLALSFTLMSVLAMAAFAGEPAPPCAPGQTEAPPCSQMTDGSTDPGETSAPPASSVDIVSITEIALESLLLY